MSYSQYEYLKQAWIKSNPNATSQEYEQAMREITRKLRL